ncbi:MAG: hypothetical protein K2J99_06145 [Lachnospiraceae bacterium]|nr:hypothetical protein [Lachnospiraceae bacterium]
MDVTKEYVGCPHCGSAIRIREVHKKIVTIDREMSGDWYQKRLFLGVQFFIFTHNDNIGFHYEFFDGCVVRKPFVYTDFRIPEPFKRTGS